MFRYVQKLIAWDIEKFMFFISKFYFFLSLLCRLSNLKGKVLKAYLKFSFQKSFSFLFLSNVPKIFILLLFQELLRWFIHIIRNNNKNFNAENIAETNRLYSFRLETTFSVKKQLKFFAKETSRLVNFRYI